MHIKTKPVYVIYKMGKLLDLSVANLDPLGLDWYFKEQFILMANASSPDDLVSFVETHFTGKTFQEATNLDEVSAMAATRDVSMLASALTKIGVRMTEIPILETLLVQLSEKTHEIPADTVFTYGPRNPEGERRRTFTGSSEEELFIRSFTDGMSGLVIALACLELLQEMDLCDPFYPQYLDEATEGMRRMIDSILGVRRAITPETFTTRLRPFFEPKTIHGRTYFAPGGAQMPFTMIDLLLWGVGETDKTIISYWNENFQYLPISYRSKIDGIYRKASIVQSVQTVVRRGVKPALTENVIASISALKGFIDQVIRFRAPHLSIAKANMKIRQQGAVGSGGYDTAILRHLIEKTKNAQRILSEARTVLC